MKVAITGGGRISQLDVEEALANCEFDITLISVDIYNPINQYINSWSSRNGVQTLFHDSPNPPLIVIWDGEDGRCRDLINDLGHRDLPIYVHFTSAPLFNL